MHTTDLPAEEDAHLTPDERRREIAAILAAGILRLRTCPESAPEELSDSAQKPLDLSAPGSPHVPAG